ESARGAGSFIDTCRAVRVFETMSKEEGKKLKIEKYRSHFRAFSGKLNFAPPTDVSEWYRFASVRLDNGGTLFGDDGDDVGVVEAWTHPGTVEVADIKPESTDAVTAALRGGQWREDPRAALWAGKAVGPIIGLDPDADADALKRLIKKLIGDKVL